MIEPVSAFFLTLDRGVERLTDFALESAVASNEGVEEPPTPNDREQLLLDVREKQAEISTPGVDEAIKGGLVLQDESGQLHLTVLGKYLLPEVEPTPEVEAETFEEQVSV